MSFSYDLALVSQSSTFFTDSHEYDLRILNLYNRFDRQILPEGQLSLLTRGDTWFIQDDIMEDIRYDHSSSLDGWDDVWETGHDIQRIRSACTVYRWRDHKGGMGSRHYMRCPGVFGGLD
jgi:hypothetical protein